MLLIATMFCVLFFFFLKSSYSTPTIMIMDICFCGHQVKLKLKNVQENKYYIYFNFIFIIKYYGTQKSTVLSNMASNLPTGFFKSKKHHSKVKKHQAIWLFSLFFLIKKHIWKPLLLLSRFSRVRLCATP